MGTLTREIIYKCDNDCEWGGCKGHTAQLKMQTTADVLEFKFHKEDVEGVWFDISSLEAFLKLVKEMSEARTEVPQIEFK